LFEKSWARIAENAKKAIRSGREYLLKQLIRQFSYKIR
jgi:hypothetical protein